MPEAFHDVRLPLDVSLSSSGGPVRKTDIVVTASGREERNQSWVDSKRKYDAGYGIKSFASLQRILAFFEERRGRLYGFRFRDRLDNASSKVGTSITPYDQVIGVGDGTKQKFNLIKTYGEDFSPYARKITKPIKDTILIGVGGNKRDPEDYEVDPLTGDVRFLRGAPKSQETVSAGFLFDVPVRFDTDALDIDLEAFEAGAVPSIPLIEVL